VQLLALDAPGVGTAAPALAPDRAIEVWWAADPVPEWIDAFCRLSRADPAHRRTMARLLAAVPAPRSFVALRRRGAIVATGLTVLERGCAGILDVVVDPALRGRGLGTRLMRHLLRWGAAHGAGYAYLQVMVGNVPAERLYAGLGFRPVYTYWYRVAGSPDCGPAGGHATTALRPPP
jgi:GNAT superfamily N-acetyltransferase